MFSQKEIKFLLHELNGYIRNTQQKLEDKKVSEKIKENVENKLITTVSIVNKLEHLQPEKNASKEQVRILIVDDVESMRKIHRHYFMECGFKNVDLAEDGARALKLMRSAMENDKPYHLVVTDLEMPKMNGLQFLKEVRMDKKLWRTPVYLISSLNEKKYIVNGLNMGANGYMVKPVNMNMIKNKFEDYLQ